MGGQLWCAVRVQSFAGLCVEPLAVRATSEPPSRKRDDEKARPKLYYGVIGAQADSFDVLSVPGVYRRGMTGAASMLFSPM